MAERAHPENPGFQDGWLGFRKNKYKRHLFDRYRFCNDYIQGREILDIPCGTGWGTSLLKGYSRCHGVDIAADAVAYASAHYARPGRLEFQVGDMANIPLPDDSLDVVICLEGFEHVTRETGSAFVAEARRLLRRDGLLIMTCPVLNERGEDSGNPFHLYEYPEEELISILNENFRVRLLERFVGPDGPVYRTVVSNIKDNRYLKSTGANGNGA